MAVGWFLAPYVRAPIVGEVRRYVIVNDLSPTIHAEGGGWSETEVLGQHAIVKVRASDATLSLVAALPGVSRIPVNRLDDQLSSLTVNQRNALRNRVTALGYTVEELSAALPGDIRNYTLRQLLTFVARRRRKVRYDAAADSIIDDGPEQAVRPLDVVEADVPDTVAARAT